jgi:hypothetical protein
MEAKNGRMVKDNDQWDAKESSDGCSRAKQQSGKCEMTSGRS